MSREPQMSGLYEVDPNPLRRKKPRFFGKIFYRNHEIECPACAETAQVSPISVVRAEFGVKVQCSWCRHPFIYHYKEITV